METLPDEPLLRAKTFLEFDFSDRKAELDVGVIRMVRVPLLGIAWFKATCLHCCMYG